MEMTDAAGRVTMYNPCVFTGALVVIKEYPAYVRCDIFMVGDCFIFTGYDELHHPAEEFEFDPNDVDAVLCADQVLIKEPQRFIVAPSKRVQWTDKGRAYVNKNLAYDGLSI